jgi:hypothetical protein
VKQVLIAGLVLGAVLAPRSAFARSTLEAPAASTHLFETEHALPWSDFDDMAQQTPPVPVVPPVPTLPNATPVPAIPAPAVPDAAQPQDPADPAATNQEGAVEDDFSIGDIPVVETVELTAEKARKALDAYVLVREKYKDASLEDYDNLQDFVDQSPQGKAFDADVKAAGFATVTEWNTTITTLSFAYDNSIDDQTADVKQQVGELQKDTEMAQDMRDRMIAALNAMIPSDNNKKVLNELKADPVFAEKLKQLATETE